MSRYTITIDINFESESEMYEIEEKIYLITAELTFNPTQVPNCGEIRQFMFTIYDKYDVCIHKSPITGYCNSLIAN